MKPTLERMGSFVKGCFLKYRLIKHIREFRGIMCTSGETFPVWGNKYIAAIKYIISYDIFFFICNWANLFHLLRSSFFFIIDECNISILLLKFIYIIVLIILKDFITFLFCSLINNLLFIYSSFNIIVQVEFYFTQTFSNENKQLMYKIMYKIIAQDGKKIKNDLYERSGKQ